MFLLLVVAAIVLLAAPQTEATFPGLNGPIVFQTNRAGFLSAARVVPGMPHQAIGLPGFGFKIDMHFAPDGRRLVYAVYDPSNTSISSLRT